MEYIKTSYTKFVNECIRKKKKRPSKESKDSAALTDVQTAKIGDEDAMLVDGLPAAAVGAVNVASVAATAVTAPLAQQPVSTPRSGVVISLISSFPCDATRDACEAPDARDTPDTRDTLDARDTPDPARETPDTSVHNTVPSSHRISSPTSSMHSNGVNGAHHSRDAEQTSVLDNMVDTAHLPTWLQDALASLCYDGMCTAWADLLNHWVIFECARLQSVKCHAR
jgi:hypothetical protein